MAVRRWGVAGGSGIVREWEEYTMNRKDIECVARYRNAYRFDKHTDDEILSELNKVKKEKKRLISGYSGRQI